MKTGKSFRHRWRENLSGKIKTGVRFLKQALPELLVVLVFALLAQTPAARVDVVIKSDAAGYYDYLPALFIYHDFVRKNRTESAYPALYKRIDKKAFYVDYKGYKVDKYPVGTAFLQGPFFLAAYWSATFRGHPAGGFEKPFQHAVQAATLFYLFAGLIFLRKILELYSIRKPVIQFSQILLVFATPVTHYANFDAGFSHVYSFFALTAFFYFSRSFFTRYRVKDFLWACAFLGLILLLRQINVLAVLFVPFLAGSPKNLKKGMSLLFHKPGAVLKGFFLSAGLFFIQCLAWYLQTGHFLLYSYQGEGFHFFNPQFINILFSYKKGLFVYTPVLFLSLFGLVWLAWQRKYYQLFAWLAFFLFITYVFSSWHSWEYGASYGSRVYIDYYAVFFILFALLIDRAPWFLTEGIILVSLLAIPVNLVQSYQYKNYILHWTDMNKERYWKVFLKTDKRFEGVLWKKQYDRHQYQTVKQVFLGNITGPVGKKFHLIYKTGSSSVPHFNRVSLIRISFFHSFPETDRAKVIVSIKDSASGKIDYWYDPYLIRFAEKQFGHWQKGCLTYSFKPLADEGEKTITIKLFSEKKQPHILKDFEIEFLVHQ